MQYGRATGRFHRVGCPRAEIFSASQRYHPNLVVNPISGIEGKKLEDLIVEMFGNLVASSAEERALFAELGYDLDGQESLEQFRTKILLLLRHCGFDANIVKIDINTYKWDEKMASEIEIDKENKITIPNPMREWWTYFQANHGNDYVQTLLSILQRIF